ncbi:MAG: peptidoglycan DD-metalloendopeptidase family protein [Chitinispirillaceae bacterium]|nr:peptidoglycan DD-metalloendopeptidase family protein [Chitinispirillaceae bacterium]
MKSRRIRNRISLLLILFSCICCGGNKKKETGAVESKSDSLSTAAGRNLPVEVSGWYTLEQEVLEGRVSHAEARSRYFLQDSLLESTYTKYKYGSKVRCFPLPGYSSKDIGGKNGEGYRPSGYNWFDGNRHGGHPAQDIFVNDTDRDCRDDKTGKPIPVVSVCRGIVVSVKTGWTEDSEIRGGNYLYIYDPWLYGYYYYAHLDSIKVAAGDTVTPGQQIATLGRTGKNAFQARSPTHLHLMSLIATAKGPQPRNLYTELCATGRENPDAEVSCPNALDIAALSEMIIVDLKYSQEDNFTGQDLYGAPDKCCLCEKPARMLVEAQRFLTEKHPGYAIVVFDCLRPRSVQKIMWEKVKGTPFQSYVADPARISMHNYGAAVDASIVDTDGRLLDMGSEFDFFGELSQPRLEKKLLEAGKLTEAQIANRHLLREIMEKAGFTSIGSEWWHFNAGEKEEIRRNYTVIE